MPYRYKCMTCEKWHEGLPDIGFSAPVHAQEVPDGEQAARVVLDTDCCVVDNEHFFIRCLLSLPVKDSDESFAWGVWSTLSEANFRRYQDRREEDLSDWEPMFGYLSNRLPHYPDTLSLKLLVRPREKGLRPSAVLEPTDHPLAVEQREGVPLERVLEFVGPFITAFDGNEPPAD